MEINDPLYSRDDTPCLVVTHGLPSGVHYVEMSTAPLVYWHEDGTCQWMGIRTDYRVVGFEWADPGVVSNTAVDVTPGLLPGFRRATLKACRDDTAPTPAIVTRIDDLYEPEQGATWDAPNRFPMAV